MNPYDKHPNAQKWTAEVVTEHLTAIAKDAGEGPSLFLGRALTRRGLYRPIWSYWKNLFLDNENIIEMMLHIESAFEAKLLEGALKKEFASSIAIFTLRYNHRWSENVIASKTNLLQKNYNN